MFPIINMIQGGQRKRRASRLKKATNVPTLLQQIQSNSWMKDILRKKANNIPLTSYDKFLFSKMKSQKLPPGGMTALVQKFKKPRSRRKSRRKPARKSRSRRKSRRKPARKSTLRNKLKYTSRALQAGLRKARRASRKSSRKSARKSCTPGPNKKFAKLVNNKCIRFGDPHMTIKKNEPGRKRSFCARHRCKSKRDPQTPGYQSCRKWNC